MDGRMYVCMHIRTDGQTNEHLRLALLGLFCRKILFVIITDVDELMTHYIDLRLSADKNNFCCFIALLPVPH